MPDSGPLRRDLARAESNTFRLLPFPPALNGTTQIPSRVHVHGDCPAIGYAYQERILLIPDPIKLVRLLVDQHPGAVAITYIQVIVVVECG